MNDEDAFLLAIFANPEDESLRLVYADWLEERGDPRGEYLRLAAAFAKQPSHEERYYQIRKQLSDLGRQIDPKWLARIGARPIQIPLFDPTDFLINNVAYEKELRERAARQQHLDSIVKAATDAVFAALSETVPRLHSHFFYGEAGIHPVTS